MAELVHLRLEHTLSELEEMKRIGLFTDSEIKSIIKNRKAHEYKLRRNSKKKVDFLKYIEYEMNLLNLVHKRRERLMCESKKLEIDTSMAKRIDRLFKAAISRFSEDQSIWRDQIEFHKKMKWFDSASATQTHMLKVHSKSPELWVMAGKWEMEDNVSPDNARKIFLKGVLRNPYSGLLWREYFRMELKYIELLQKRAATLAASSIKDSSANMDDDVLKGLVANVVYDEAVKAIEDVEYALSFIEICLEFDFGARHVEYILQDVEKKYPNREETLDAIAKKPLVYIDQEIKKGKENGMKKRTILENINQEIFEKYEEAVLTLSTEKMWGFYIDYILSLIESAKEKRKSKLQDSALDVIHRASRSDCLSSSYLTIWVDLLFEKGCEEDALNVCLDSARKLKTVDLWLKCLTYHIQSLKSYDLIYDLLIESLDSVKIKDSVNLWVIGVEWLSMCCPHKLNEFFKRGIKMPKEISVPLKEMFLELTAIKEGVEAAKMLYKKFKKMNTLFPPIVKKIIQIERTQLKPSLKCLREYFEDGIQAFGTNDIDIWLDYMKLEVEHKDGNIGAWQEINWRASKTLNPDLLREFQTRMVELSTGCNVPSNLLSVI